MILNERKASHSVASTPPIIAVIIEPDPVGVEAEFFVPVRGTSPVSRTRTPVFWIKAKPVAAPRPDRAAGAPAGFQLVVE